MDNNTKLTFGGMVAALALVLVAGSFEVARSTSKAPVLRSEHAQPANHVPPEASVVVSLDGKTFHASSCTFIHDKTRQTIAAAEATRQGYVPCVQCMKKFLKP